MAILHVLRVFVDEGGAGGNPLGVFLEGHEVPEQDRQKVAADLGFSETVFVEDTGRGELRIFTPTAELPFAGHPLVGTAWLLAREGVGAWAWEDEEMGHVRTRVFPSRLGIEEDEATGAHAVLLGAHLGREIKIHQGKGSLILARPRPDGTVEIGGRTELIEVRPYQ